MFIYYTCMIYLQLLGMLSSIWLSKVYLKYCTQPCSSILPDSQIWYCQSEEQSPICGFWSCYSLWSTCCHCETIWPWFFFWCTPWDVLFRSGRSASDPLQPWHFLDSLWTRHLFKKRNCLKCHRYGIDRV